MKEVERKNQQLRKEMGRVQGVLQRKEQECSELREAVNDAPKIEELNRWIAKVKEYEEKQLAACARVSQMGQDLCSSKEKCRKLEH